MLFNRKFVFCQFPLLFNGNLRLEKLWGGMYGCTDVRTYGRLEIHPCVLQDIGPLGPLPKKGNFDNQNPKLRLSYSFCKHSRVELPNFESCFTNLRDRFSKISINEGYPKESRK